MLNTWLRSNPAGAKTLILTLPILIALQLNIPTANTITSIYLDPILMQEFWCQRWGWGQELGTMPDFQECGPVSCSHVPGKASSEPPRFSSPPLSPALQTPGDTPEAISTGVSGADSCKELPQVHWKKEDSCARCFLTGCEEGPDVRQQEGRPADNYHRFY